MREADDLSGDYRAAGFGGSLGFGKRPSVIVVDPAEAYFAEGSPLYAGVEHARDGMIRLVALARDHQLPVIWTRVEYQAGGADGGHFYRKVKALSCFDRGNPLGDFARGLEPRGDEVVVTKQYASAFFGTTLASTLTSLGVDTCLVSGLSTSGCVRATALDALQHGFIPIVIADACGDRDRRVHDSNLFDLAAKYADLMTVAEVAAYLASAATDPTLPR